MSEGQRDKLKTWQRPTFQPSQACASDKRAPRAPPSPRHRDCFAIRNQIGKSTSPYSKSFARPHLSPREALDARRVGLVA